MGERLCALLEDHPELVLAAALERPGHPALGRELAPGVRLGEDAAAAMASVEIAIVFANPAATLSLVRLAARLSSSSNCSGCSSTYRTSLARSSFAASNRKAAITGQSTSSHTVTSCVASRLFNSAIALSSRGSTSAIFAFS
jgi:4-hydroxy-tetrahydrodipicolinate reductase